MDHEPQQRHAPFRIDRSKQLEDIYIFEQRLREGASEVELTRKKFQALMFSMVVLNGVAIWHALRWKISPEGTFWSCTFSYMCAYLPVVVGGGCLCWIILHYYQRVDDAATYVTRCNSVLRSYRTYYCPNTGKLVVLRHATPGLSPSTQPTNMPPHTTHSPPGSNNATTSIPHSSVLSPQQPRPVLTQRHHK